MVKCSVDHAYGGDVPSGEPAFDGALVVLTGSGAKGLDPPPRAPYYYTQGFLLCRDGHSSDPAPVLRSVAYDVNVEPLEIRPIIRRIPDGGQRKGVPGVWTPIIDMVGRPGDVGFEARGDFSTDFDGTRVTLPCDESNDPESELMELDIVMKVPREGADIDGFTITYEIDGDEHDLHVPWRMIGCGTEVGREWCTSPS